MSGAAAVRSVVVATALAAAVPAAAAKKPLAPGEQVDLNRAPVEELMRLPGVGRKRAEAIAAMRSQRPFRKPDEVVRVKGLGPAWLAKARPHLTVGEQAAAAKPPAPPTGGSLPPAAAASGAGSGATKRAPAPAAVAASVGGGSPSPR